MLELAIDANSTRCTALLLDHKAAGNKMEFSLDEFTLNDLPANALAGEAQDKQGDNGAMKLLFPEEENTHEHQAGQRADRAGGGRLSRKE